ncbi:MAG: acetyl-CoA carboxylase, biotin carboxyl carrier protein [Sphingomonadaceae bacterium]|nr:acetyl-CoA carboxylase, biotin carboxyl carrier protein [Sphingomonadaceae bacterium]
MILTAKDIAEIAKLLDDSQFTDLKLEMGDFRLRISRGGGAGGSWSAPVEDNEIAGTEPPSSNPVAAAPAAAPASGGPAAGEQDVVAPLLGNYYAAPRPGDPAFVSVGDRVEPDTIIAIIEVMKLMNPIRAGVAGIVTALLAENGTAVEEGQPLIRVKAG